jgi:hypothetical protein
MTDFQIIAAQAAIAAARYGSRGATRGTTDQKANYYVLFGSATEQYPEEMPAGLLREAELVREGLPSIGLDEVAMATSREGNRAGYSVLARLTTAAAYSRRRSKDQILEEAICLVWKALDGSRRNGTPTNQLPLLPTVDVVARATPRARPTEALPCLLTDAQQTAPSDFWSTVSRAARALTSTPAQLPPGSNRTLVPGHRVDRTPEELQELMNLSAASSPSWAGRR